MGMRFRERRQDGAIMLESRTRRLMRKMVQRKKISKPM